MITYANNQRMQKKKKIQVVKLLDDINEEIIQKNSDSGSYKRGIQYYLSNKVVNIRYRYKRTRRLC